MIRLRLSVTISLLLLFASIAARITLGQPVKEQSTGSSLDSQIEGLLRAEYIEDNDSAAVARVQNIFNQYKVPAKGQASRQAVADFLILLVKDQPLLFMEKALPFVKAAAATGRVSPNSYLFFQVSLKQREVESRLGAPTNPELQKQIEALLQSDQAPRQKKDFSPKKMVQVDEQNRAAIQSILNRFGMPTFAMVGSQAATDFVILIQHQPADFRRQALPELKQNVDDAQGDAKDYAMMYDRTQSDQGKPEVYGVNLVCQTDGKVRPGPLVDPEHVDERRAAIGLMPLQTYINLAAVVMPPNFCRKASDPAKK